MFTGPNKVKDGLVLSLDAGSTRSFRGEPTTNLRLQESNGQYARFNYISGQWTYEGIETSGEFKGWEKIIATRTSTANRLIMGINGITAQANTQYTASIEFVSPFNNLSFELTGNQGIGVGNRIGDTNRYFRTFTKNATTGGQHWYLRSTEGGANFDIDNGIIYYRQVQWEEKPYPTPFVNGTRGTTVATGGGWADLTQNNNHGELINGPIFNSDNFGSIQFDGVDASIPVINPGISQTFTVTSWANCSNVSVANNIVSKNGPYFMRISNSRVRFNVLAGGSWVFQNGTTILNNNVWYNFTMVYDGTTWKGYINGDLEFSVNKTGSITSNAALYIGYTPVVGEQAGFNGDISQVQIYNRALSPEEILQNYNATKNRYL
jgi:hypothetical protein